MTAAASSQPNTAASNVMPLRVAKPRPRDVEFLPAALEIIETPASPTARWTALAIATLFVIAILWACLGKLDIVAVAPGKVIPSGRVKVVQPFETGVVRAILVKDGEAVKAGAPLIALDPTVADADSERVARELMQTKLDSARLRTLIEPGAVFKAPDGVSPSLAFVAQRLAEAQAAEQTAKLAALDRQIAQRKAEAASIASTITRLNTELPLLTQRVDIRHALAEKQLTSKLVMLEAEQQQVSMTHEIKVQTDKLAEAEAGSAALEREKARSEAEFARTVLTSLTEAETKAAGLEQEAIKLAQKTALQTLRAPVDGRVQQLQVHTVGGVVTPAQQLMAIVPDEGGLEVEARIENKDVGFVQVGQSVEVKVEAFNFTRYGLLHGKVIDITRDAVEQPQGAAPREGEMAEQAPPPGSVYIARVTLDRTSIDTERGVTEVGPGMAVTAEIKTGQRRVIQYILSPLSRYAHEAARER
jgi:hemolysin D